MIGYMSVNWATKFIVILLQLLCTSVFGLMQTFCSAFMNLASLEMGTSFINDFMDRIYIIVGIIMLFKLTFTLFTSIVNPDALTDKEKGFGKVVQRTIVSLIMLIFVPIIFAKILGWQVSLARLVPRLIVGSEFQNTETTNNVGAQLASDALKPFIIPNDECNLGYDALNDNLDDTTNLRETLAKTILTCEEEGGTGKDIFAYEFNGLIASVVGIIMIVILAGYCVDMAIRVIKLGILRVLAPIPIISYIDPKSEKGGAFGNWLKECISTYIELFIKLGIFYFVLEILGNLSSENVDFFANSQNLDGFVLLFVMIGAFFFMGKAAEFICNILGIKKPSGGAGGVISKALAASGLAGVGALITGGGLTGAAIASYHGLKDGGKGKLFDSFNKGRDIATQFKSGGKETKYQTLPQRLEQRLRSNRMAKDIFGVDNVEDAQKMLDAAKAAMLNDDARFKKAESLLNSGEPFEWDGKEYSTPEDFAQFRSMIYDGKDSLLSIKNQSSSKYSDLKEAAQYAGFKNLNKTSSEKATEAMEYFDKKRNDLMSDNSNRYRATRNASSSNPVQQPTVNIHSTGPSNNISSSTNVVPEMVSNMMNHIETPKSNNNQSQSVNAASDMVSNMTRHIQNTNNNSNNGGNNSNK